MQDRGDRYEALAEKAEVLSLPLLLLALIIALGFLWYLNSGWRASARSPQVAVAVSAPEPSPVRAGRPD
jgi:hypothetical protein